MLQNLLLVLSTSQGVPSGMPGQHRDLHAAAQELPTSANEGVICRR